ncbi:hypothetical protein [Streptomyces barringtoniae]|uniref:hypothetical protein n=1 Tax=Streptomyces barringtoniae TaxID=2892029 RepID=UPI001E29674E|nr:hypothetical protein [Streptomyces barringtoniae]MCC5480686.1 hypothetical protein [Streptomyces barringtoniae]
MTTPRTEPEPRTEPRSVLPRVLGAAVTGAVLATSARAYLSWAGQHSDRLCRTTDTLCFTGWNLTALPLVFTVSLTVLLVVYKRLGIRPRLAVVPPTLVLAPIPLAAADTTAVWWAVALVGGAWSSSFALAAWSRYQIPALAASAVLLLASLVVLYG